MEEPRGKIPRRAETIDAPESTTNSLASGFKGLDGASRHQFSEGEKNVVVCFSFIFLDIFGQPPRCLTGITLLPFRLFLSRSSNLGDLGLR